MPLLLALLLSATAASPRGAVATGHPAASAAAAQVLREGGNAVDAAVAAAFALGVVEPQSSGIGGGGFALVYLAREDRVVALDFREVAPAGASATMFAGGAAGAGPSRSLDGGLAVAVPGAVKGYAELARRFGTRPLRRLVEPAARLAEQGAPVNLHYVRTARARLACLGARPEAARTFLDRGAGNAPVAPAPGWRLRQPELARTLRTLGRDPEAFYRGPLARRIARAARAEGGVLTEADLAAYRTRERTPLEGRYRGHRVVSMPLPSSGGSIVVGLLQALEHEDPRAGGYRPERFLHAMAEVEKRLFARRAVLGDAAFVPAAAQVERELVSPEGAARLAAAVGERAAVVDAPPPTQESSQTSHLSVVDREGNAVALTTTVNFSFGSCVVVPGTGILLNDEMDDFDAAPGAANVFGAVGTGANAPAPGKVPLSSMAPTLVFDRAGKLALVVGAAGGTTIPTTVAQVISHVVDDGMGLAEALAAPRIHHQWRPDALQVEPNGLEAATARALEARGHRLLWRERRWSNAHAARVAPEGWVEAASDPLLEGGAAVP
ncbi:gamma-glutamyltransferase [Anaeromyxobacter dehalogenans 2CP-1]|uniref:Glutathione hydrolase proenzyme n=1 Tax=Anaeromyxobacter dehalogenans (strain ATCC BAA-258 / DSM 21875 / 2CP-1) TaxID=455488 RepID=B8J9N0_ANAD2|nr:gamma-glutamyltransferase [Anaeromyxobacter dehalogenans]ACL67418.1 gamma-glutamyltransferase [Anaeromyxobacter dehalogenans 2CP-1]